MARGWTNSCVSTGATPSIAPPACTNIVVTKGNGQFSLTWTDPVAQGDNYTWKETVVRYKAGSAPTSATDGTVAVVETTRNQYVSTPLTVTGLTNGVTYYISVFPKSTSGGINTDGSQIVSVTPVAQKIYTIRIDQSNSNPLTCCTYADDAVGMTKGSSEWDDIFGYKPCIMRDGVVEGYLDPDNFAWYDEVWSLAPITDTNYDVMIEFPRMGLDISTSGKIITIKLTDAKNDSNFHYLAHKRGTVQKDYFYLGAYSATGSGSKLGSNSGAAPLVDTSITDFINYAHNRGSGYEIMAFYQWTYVQALYVMKYGNLNSQAALGKGYTSGSSVQTTGATNTQGMCYGNPNSGTDRMKLFGLEDLWGNVYQFISGLYSDNNRNLFTTTDNFGVNKNVNAWEYNVSSGVVSNTGGYMTKSQGTNNGGFIYKAGNNNSTTYYSDYASLSASGFPHVGGNWDDDDFAGAFDCRVYYSESEPISSVGSRLMFL